MLADLKDLARRGQLTWDVARAASMRATGDAHQITAWIETVWVYYIAQFSPTRRPTGDALRVARLLLNARDPRHRAIARGVLALNRSMRLAA